MTLRHKFGFLALIYAVSLTANVALCAWCIVLYHSSLLEGFALQTSDSVSPAKLPANSVPPAARLSPAAAESPPEDEIEAEPSEGSETNPARRQILHILLANAACGLGLALLGSRLVQRWVSQPVAGLRDAAAQIAGGNLDHRIPGHGTDEIGLLAGEVNEMASLVLQMRERLAEQERQAIAAQTVRCVVHNIRSPLTGIRWLAEAVAMRDDVNPQTIRDQEGIVARVDRVMGWLQQFRDALVTATLAIRPVPARDLIDELLGTLRSRLDEQKIESTTTVEPENGTLRVDPQHFKPALEAIAGHLLGQMRPGHRLTVSMTRHPGPPPRWRLVLEPLRHGGEEDTSPIANASPARTGREAGSGGLLVAERVIQMHGGTLDRQTEPGGDRFIVTLTEA